MRCVNIDWLEVYVIESMTEYPQNADYYRAKGLFVKERDYGTRVYNEMFTIEDEDGQPFMEVRRNPASGNSDFVGLCPQSCHLRLTNVACYKGNPVQRMIDFILHYNYEFQRIYRIDVCYDFEKFDSGDDPAKFCRRYLANRYSKINQCKLSAHGEDNWSAFDWETLSWGSRHSMVSTKLYCKTKELMANGNNKPYITYAWFLHGLISDPINLTKKNKKGEVYKPMIWRVEFSMKSAARGWIVIEDTSGKRTQKKTIEHRLSLFDSKDKLWQRFQDLAYHYFRFVHYQDGVRKDRCKPKDLFLFNSDRNFMKIDALPSPTKAEHEDVVLRRKLMHYRQYHVDPKIRQACDVILSALDSTEARRVAPGDRLIESQILQAAIKLKMDSPERDIIQILAEVTRLITKKEIL